MQPRGMACPSQMLSKKVYGVLEKDPKQAQHQKLQKTPILDGCSPATGVTVEAKRVVDELAQVVAAVAMVILMPAVSTVGVQMAKARWRVAADESTDKSTGAWCNVVVVNFDAGDARSQ
jgi:protein gp37